MRYQLGALGIAPPSALVLEMLIEYLRGPIDQEPQHERFERVVDVLRRFEVSETEGQRAAVELEAFIRRLGVRIETLHAIVGTTNLVDGAE